MDKRVTFHKLREMMKEVPLGNISLGELRQLIIMNIGSSERTIYSCLRIMDEMKMIKEIDNNKFEVISNKL